MRQKLDLERTVISLPSTEKRQLQEWCIAHGVPLSYAVRTLISQFLQQQQQAPVAATLPDL